MSIETSFRLNNGLRVYVQESHAAPVVALQVWVNVGSADERPEEAGIAHQLEHMMFKGTPRRGVGKIAQEVEGAGGDINAFTSYDQTVYHITMASRHFDLGLDLLSDLIQNSLIDADELKMEKEVVLEEVRRYLDNPGRQMSQAMFKTAFTHHQYGRPIIGYEETVKSFQQDDVRGFYQRWYSPDNMVLVVVGDVDAQNVKKSVTKAFKGFSRPAAPRRARSTEPPQVAPRFVGLHQAVQEAQLELAFPVPQGDHPDTALLDLLALILGQGESSRLVERVRNQKQLVNSIHAYAYTPHDPGLLMVGAGFEPSRLREVYSAILEELHTLRHTPPRASEVRKAQSILQSERVYERETVDGRARKFGFYLLSDGGLEREKAYYRTIESATAEDIWRVARTYLAPEKLTLGVMLPKEMPLPDGHELLMLGTGMLTEDKKQSPAVLISRREAQTVRIELPNGIRLLVRENHSVPLVAMRAVFEGGLRYEKANNNGVTRMMAAMLTKGTERRKGAQIAHEVESLAGSMGGFAGHNSFGLRAELLSQHLERGMELFSEILREPSFDAHELDKLRRVTLEAIRNQTDHPSSYVFRTFAETLYKRHPYRMSTAGTETSVKALTPDMLRKTWEQYARTGNMVLSVVGDVDVADMEALALRYLGDFRSGTPKFPTVPVEPPLLRTRTIHTDSDKQQLHMVIGWRAVAMDHPDRYPLQVLSSIMSGQGGRLFIELRDKKGLAYSVSTTSLEGLGEGWFGAYIGCDASKYERARAGILFELDQVAQHGVTEDEVKRAQRYLVGSYEIELQRAASLCANLALNELYGLGYDDYKLYPERIAAVTPAKVLDVARRYLKSDCFVLATVGPKLEG